VSALENAPPIAAPPRIRCARRSANRRCRGRSKRRTHGSGTARADACLAFPTSLFAYRFRGRRRGRRQYLAHGFPRQRIAQHLKARVFLPHQESDQLLAHILAPEEHIHEGALVTPELPVLAATAIPVCQHLPPLEQTVDAEGTGPVRLALAFKVGQFAAAQKAHLDPDRISFTRTIHLLEMATPIWIMAEPQDLPVHYERLLKDVDRKPLPPRRSRANPRVVKRKMSSFPLKRQPQHQGANHLRPFKEVILVI
jgi:hypothetical protein